MLFFAKLRRCEGLISQNFANAKFRENKNPRKMARTHCRRDILLQSTIFNDANMSFNAIRENEILAIICEFTVDNGLNSKTMQTIVLVYARRTSILISRDFCLAKRAL